MNIILGSENVSKERAIQLALKELEIEDATITKMTVDSKVSSKPINEDTLLGARNRNQELLNYCRENNIPFDLLISIEGGYEEVADRHYIVTYASIINSEGEEYSGKSESLEISKKMFEWVKNGHSLNKVIESIMQNKENKKKQGITGFLTGGYYRRDKFESSAVVSAILAMLNKDTYKALDNEIEVFKRLEKLRKDS